MIQKISKIPRIHFPIIQDVNDDRVHLKQIRAETASRGLRVELNLIEFNPAADDVHKPGNIERTRLMALQEGFHVKRIPKVGFDVNASCGMFANERKM